MDNPLTLQEAKDQVAESKKAKNFQGELINSFKDYVSIYGASDNLIDECMKLYAKAKWDEACEAQRKECSRCLEVDIPKSPTHNLVLYAPKPEFKP